MAREWFVFNLKPERHEDNRPYNKSDLQSLHARVEEWISTNKRKSAKLQLVSMKSGSGLTTWERLSDNFPSASLRVKFRSHRDAVLFKMFFSEYLWTPMSASSSGYDKVILPLIRRVMPNVIAHDICGVSPMTGPVGSIFALRTKYKSPAILPKTPKPSKLFGKEWEAMKQKIIDDMRRK